MNYDTMRRMTTEFNNAKKQLDETLQAVKKLGSQMEAGGLQGKAGETFRGAINGPLEKSLTKLSAKMEQLAGDVEDARAALEEGVSKAQGRFRN
jgi:uncharacterized protein YukE